MNKVCAVIVTYNRKKLLLRNVQSILSQSVFADILIYDNASSDKTSEYLMQNGVGLYQLKKGEKPFENEKKNSALLSMQYVFYYRAMINSGGAGGFSAGISMAHELGYEYIWLMDDDGYCLNNNTLSILLNASQTDSAAPRRAVLNSLVLCSPKEEGGDDELSFLVPGGSEHIPECYLQQSEVSGEAGTFNSTFFHRQLVDEIGSVNPEFFIYGDDTDYVERAIEKGYEIVTVMDSRYFHPKQALSYKEIFGKKFALRDGNERNLYLYVRNYMYIMKHYRTKKQAILHIPKVLFKCFFYEEDKLKKIKATVLGLMDGWHDRLGHPKKYGY